MISLNRLRPSLLAGVRWYRAAILKKFGDPLVVEDLPDPTDIGKSQVLVKVESAGVNHADLLMVQNKHHAGLKLPCTPGFEFSGEIKAIGTEVKRFSVGDRILGLKTHSTGAFAELCLAEESELSPIPHSLSYDMAASLPVAYGSALLALKEVANVNEGDSVLILSTQGSIGVAAVDLCINLFKCKVFFCSDSEAKCAVVRPKGVEATIVQLLSGDNSGQLNKEIRKKTGGKGVDLVLDMVGGSWFQDGLQCLRLNGRLCSLGFSSGVVPVVSLQELIGRQAAVMGVWLGGYAEQKPKGLDSLVETIISSLDDQLIDPYVGQKFQLGQVNEALAHVDSQAALGKIVLQTAK